MIAIAKLLITLGLQSLRAHKTKSLIVGGLMTFGAFLVVSSLALLGSVERSTRQSVVQSISGDMQVYSAKAPDQLALLGGVGFGTEDIGEVESFAKLKDAVVAVDGVKGVVPMGIANASVSTPGDLDRALNALRDAVRSGDMDNAKALGVRVRNLGVILQDQRSKQAAITSTVDDDSAAILARVTSDALWQEFAADPLPVIDWLDTKFAPLGEQGTNYLLRIVGTDIEAFGKSFTRTKIVQGEMMPPGARGILIGQNFLDSRAKLNVAMNLDKIHKERSKGATIAGTPVLQETIARTQRQASRVQFLLSPADVPVVEKALVEAMPGAKPGDLQALLKEFLALTDENFDARFKLFYDVIAPRIQIYPIKVGDTITLTAFTKSGYVRSVNAKVWGIYSIEGLESSGVAGALSLTDLVTFRELYGQRTAALDAELLAMKEAAKVQVVDRASAEDALFGGGDEVAVVDAAAATAEGSQADAALSALAGTAVKRAETFDPAVENGGMVLSAAVLVKDGASPAAVMEAVQKAVEPLGLKAVDWQQATGIVGQITLVVRGVLLTAIFILFLVTIVILNNSMVMATLERVAEFGTLRAIGAQKRFINAMVLFETAVLGAIAGSVGALAGVLVIVWLGKVGIPAPAQLIEVIFGGPNLYPTFTAGNVIAGLVATLIISVFATIYPARLAVKVQPVVAMQGKE